MQFNHDNMTGPALAAALVNLEGSGTWSRETLLETLHDHQIRRPELTEQSCDDMRVWARRLRTVFAAASVEDRCGAINGLLADGAGNAYVTTHDDLRPHLHFAAEDQDVLSRVKAVTAGGLAIFTVEAEGSRLGVCSRQTCITVYVDTSRNGRRGYCNARCGNADAVQRYRANAK